MSRIKFEIAEDNTVTVTDSDFKEEQINVIKENNVYCVTVSVVNETLEIEEGTEIDGD